MKKILMLLIVVISITYLKAQLVVPAYVNRAAKQKPVGNNWQKLIPKKLGTFKEADNMYISESGMYGDKSYSSLSGNEVFVTFVLMDSIIDVREEIYDSFMDDYCDIMYKEAINLAGKNMFAWSICKEGTSCLVWQRGRYIFKVKAYKSAKDLEDFMKVFPY